MASGALAVASQIPVVGGIGVSVGSFVANLFGGGPSAKELNLRETRADGHAAGSGNVASVARLLSAAQFSKYQERRNIALQYLADLAVGKAYDGRQYLTATPAVQAAAKAALVTLGTAPTNGLLSNGGPLIPNTGNGTFVNNNPSSQPTGFAAPDGTQPSAPSSIAPLWLLVAVVGGAIAAKKFKLI